MDKRIAKRLIRQGLIPASWAAATLDLPEELLVQWALLGQFGGKVAWHPKGKLWVCLDAETRAEEFLIRNAEKLAWSHIHYVMDNAPKGVEVDEVEFLRAIGAILYRAQRIQAEEETRDAQDPEPLWYRLREALRYPDLRRG